MRAFAKSLGMAPSTLSDVFSGRRKLSSDKIFEIARRIGLTLEETEHLQLLSQLEAANSPEARAWIEQKIERRTPHGKSRDLTVDQFKLIAVWYHYAILELMDLPGFELTANEAARRLGITSSEAALAIDVLERLELISQNDTGKWVRLQEQVQVISAISAPAMIRVYRQMLEKTAESLDGQKPDERISGSQTLAFDPEQHKEMKSLMNEFLDRAAAIAAKGRRKTHVYHLSTHFFRLTKKEGAKA